MKVFMQYLFFCILFVVVCSVSPCFAYQQHQVFFQNTDYELHIYRIYGDEPGKTLLIIGGIQGNEPGGYLAADMYVELSLKKGNLIVVPRANFWSIIKNVRGVNGDMNRKFAGGRNPDRDTKIIEKLKELIHESDFLLNLHDGSGYYSTTWISDMRNPMRYGQSIIADCDEFTSKKSDQVFQLGEMARRVCSRVNPAIKKKGHHFHFNNHNTAASNSKHAEQRLSATYFALTQHEIPAFGIETSKNIKSPAQRVRYQTMIINAFMEEFGIVPHQPSIALPDPHMNYLIASVNDRPPVVVYNDEPLVIEKGDAIQIIHIEANYERGITANIVGVGSYNDIRKQVPIHKPTKILVKKDNMKCGSVPVVFKKSSGRKRVTRADIKYLIMQVNDTKLALSPEEHVKIPRGASLILLELVTRHKVTSSLKVNFKGFVGNQVRNDGEDRGYTINTASDLMVKYSLARKGKTYPIHVTRKGKTVATFFVDIVSSSTKDSLALTHR